MISKIEKYYIFIIAVLCICLTGCVTLKPVDIGGIKDAKVKEFSIGSLTADLQIPIKNPNNFKIKVKKVKIDVSLKNSQIGKIKKISKVTIPANSNEVHMFTATIEFTGVSDILSLMNMHRSDLKVTGYIKVKAFLFSRKIRLDNENVAKLFKMKY